MLVHRCCASVALFALAVSLLGAFSAEAIRIRSLAEIREESLGSHLSDARHPALVTHAHITASTTAATPCTDPSSMFHSGGTTEDGDLNAQYTTVDGQAFAHADPAFVETGAESAGVTGSLGPSSFPPKLIREAGSGYGRGSGSGSRGSVPVPLSDANLIRASFDLSSSDPHAFHVLSPQAGANLPSACSRVPDGHTPQLHADRYVICCSSERMPLPEGMNVTLYTANVDVRMMAPLVFMIV